MLATFKCGGQANVTIVVPNDEQPTLDERVYKVSRPVDQLHTQPSNQQQWWIVGVSGRLVGQLKIINSDVWHRATVIRVTVAQNSNEDYFPGA